MITDKDLSFYIVPSWKCNLRCPHCFVNNLPEDNNKDKFFNTLKECKEKYPDAGFILHGGEPTYNKSLLRDILELNIVNSITTNLLFNDDEIIDMLNSNNLSIATSWNPSRFLNKDLFKLWNSNLSKLSHPVMALITLDKDLLKIPASDIVNTIRSFNNVDKVLFEPLLDNNLDDDFQDKIDELLCNIHNEWNIDNITNLIEQQILNWNFACNTRTILPNGSIHNKCTMADSNHKPRFLDKCLKCKYNKVCVPCSLHTRCSFYPKFYEVIKNA